MDSYKWKIASLCTDLFMNIISLFLIKALFFNNLSSYVILLSYTGFWMYQ